MIPDSTQPGAVTGACPGGAPASPPDTCPAGDLLTPYCSPSSFTPGAKPDGPRDLLLDAKWLRDLARIYAALGCDSITAALDNAADLTEEMHHAIVGHHVR